MVMAVKSAKPTARRSSLARSRPPRTDMKTTPAAQRAAERALVRPHGAAVREARVVASEVLGERHRAPAVEAAVELAARRAHREDVPRVVEDDDRLVDRVDDVAQLGVTERLGAMRALSPLLEPLVAAPAPAAHLVLPRGG